MERPHYSVTKMVSDKEVKKTSVFFLVSQKKFIPVMCHQKPVPALRVVLMRGCAIGEIGATVSTK